MPKTFLLSGCSRGVGLALTRELLQQGHNVIATARIPKASEALQDLLTDYPDTCVVKVLNVTVDSSIGILIDDLTGKHTVDVVVNNAGVLCEKMADLEDLSFDDFRRTFEVNTIGAMRLTRAILPLMRDSDQPTVVNISSNIGSIAENDMTQAYAYCMSKAALNMFTSMLARAQKEILCVSIHPGWVLTDMGGEDAAISPEESAEGLYKVIDGLKPSDSGKFYEYTGRERCRGETVRVEHIRLLQPNIEHRIDL